MELICHSNYSFLLYLALAGACKKSIGEIDKKIKIADLRVSESEVMTAEVIHTARNEKNPRFPK